MKLLYCHENFARVGLVRGVLQNEGILVVTRNEHLSSLAGGIPSLDTWPQLWVADEDLRIAQDIISQFQNATESRFEDWVCPHCGAANEGNMGLCWNCDWEVDGPLPG